mgnify:CR=1 FL=1
MKFKDYKNPITKDSKIYSRTDMYDMTLRELRNRVDELAAQEKLIGLPSVSVLKSSGNVIWIEEYTRDDGTKVCGHWRSKPGEGKNLGSPTGGAVHIYNESEKTNIASGRLNKDNLVEIKTSDLSDIKLKRGVKLSKFQVYLINYNNAQ